MSTRIYLPPISNPPIPARVAKVRRMPGHFAGEGDPVVDLELFTQGGRHVLTICSPFDGKIMRCRNVGDVIRPGEHVIEVTGVGTPTWEVFVAYRRNDAPGHAGRVGQGLIDYFGPGQVFKDIETLAPGEDFASIIRGKLQRAFVMVVIIGPRWIDDPRLQNPGDLHREEIRTALERGIAIIPVLVNDAKIPTADRLPEDIRAVVGRLAVGITDDRWVFDLGRLQKRVEEVLTTSPARLRFLVQVPPFQSGPGWQCITDNPEG